LGTARFVVSGGRVVLAGGRAWCGLAAILGGKATTASVGDLWSDVGADLLEVVRWDIEDEAWRGRVHDEGSAIRRERKIRGPGGRGDDSLRQCVATVF
jgi:hypothetical protein